MLSDTLLSCVLFLFIPVMIAFALIVAEGALMIGIYIYDELASRWRDWKREHRRR